MRLTRIGRLSLGILVGSTLAGGLLGRSALAGGGGKLNDELRLYTSILSAIQDEYVEEVPAERLVSASVREMLRSLDPHSNFLETREYSSLQERQKGSYYGLGIQVQSIEGNITVVAPFEGTPAHRLGIRAGDVISRIENEDARGMSIDDAVKRLRGPKGTAVHISVVRQGYEQPLEFTVLRDEIPLHSVPYHFMVSSQTGYVRLTDFNETTACRPNEPPSCQNELERALAELRRQGASSVVLDLRDNPGVCSTRPSPSRTCSSRRASWWSSPAAAAGATSSATSPSATGPGSTCRWWCSSRGTAPAPPRSWRAPCRTTTAR